MLRFGREVAARSGLMWLLWKGSLWLIVLGPVTAATVVFERFGSLGKTRAERHGWAALARFGTMWCDCFGLIGTGTIWQGGAWPLWKDVVRSTQVRYAVAAKDWLVVDALGTLRTGKAALACYG
jgi:hypothetical protein